MIEFPNHEANLREQEYSLKCKVLIKEVAYEDFQSKGKLGTLTEKMAFLIPQEGSQRDTFFTAWLPDYEQNAKKEIVSANNEVACKTGYPVNGFFRASVRRADARVREPHIFVMSRSTEEDLKALNGQFIIITVLPDSESHKSDYARDFELSDSPNV